MRLNMVFAPDPLDCRATQSTLLRHQPHAPMRGVLRPGMQRLFDYCGLLICRDLLGPAGSRSILKNPNETFLLESASPLQHGGETGRELPSQNLVSHPLGGAQHNSCAHCNSLRSSTRTTQHRQLPSVRVANLQGRSGSEWHSFNSMPSFASRVKIFLRQYTSAAAFSDTPNWLRSPRAL